MAIAAIYTRKSNAQDDRSAEAKSVARQAQHAREYAVKKGWRVDERFVFTDDAVSGAEFRKRAGLQRLLESLKPKPKFQILVISEPSRLGREQIETAYVLKQIVDEGVRVFSYLDDKELTLDSALEKFMATVQHFASESEREQGSKRVRDKMKELAEQGRSTGGRLYGYAVGELGRRTIKPDEAAVVRRVFKRRSEGAGHFKIARELEQSKVPAPRGGASWSPTQVGSILKNPMYSGAVVWGRMRRARRRGTAVTEKSPHAPVRRQDESLRIVSERAWAEVQRINEAAAASTWRGEGGRLTSRPTASPHLLTPFLACALCEKPMHHRRDGAGREWLICSTFHRYGKKKCPNTKQLSVALAERAIIRSFEEALAGALVMDRLQEVLEQQRRARQDPALHQAEARRLRAEIGRLVESLARGEVEEVHQAVAERRARLAAVEAELAGTSAIQSIDTEKFRAGVLDALEDWRAGLRRNKSVAAQVIRKILPRRLRVSPQPDGSWTFEGTTDYRKVLLETGYDAVLDAAKAHGLVPGDAELPPEVRAARAERDQRQRGRDELLDEMRRLGAEVVEEQRVRAPKTPGPQLHNTGYRPCR